MDRQRHYFLLPLDSKEGMEKLAEWARAHRLVLNRYHEQLAKKHGVSLEGVIVSRDLPIRFPMPGKWLPFPKAGDPESKPTPS